MSWIDALILGLVEGITEFLPVSSTGHLILARSFLGLSAEQVDWQLIVIQGAAILAVCWEYRARLWETVAGLPRERRAQRFALMLILAFLPAAILGLLLDKPIERVLFAPIPVALALIIGGVLILLVERLRHGEHIGSVDEIRPSDALKIGLFQSLALIPGTSRSAATILGGLLLGLSRRTATEFSFFVAIPTLLAATAYKLWQARHVIDTSQAAPLAISSIVSFVAALLSIRLLLRFVSRHSFAAFAWYRIGFGVLVLAAALMGLVRV